MPKATREPPAAYGVSALANKDISEVTASKPFSPRIPQLSKVAAQTNASTNEYQETVSFIKSQLLRTDSKWRQYFRTLVVVEYLLYFGNQRCVKWTMENIGLIKRLELFDHSDKDAERKVRYAAKQVVFLLSDEKRLLREREETKNWKSIIPELHSPEASFTSATSTPLASNSESRASEGPKKATSKKYKLRKESEDEKTPPLTTGIFDKISSPLSIKEAPIKTSEISFAPKFHSQKPCDPRDQLRNAQERPQLISNSPSQSMAPTADANLFSQVSSTIQSPLAMSEVTRSSYSLVIDSTSAECKLGEYFSSARSPRTPYTDAECQDIASLLCEIGKDSWSRVPRIYIILRKIGQLQVIDGFIGQGINDIWLPFTLSSLPRVLGLAYHPEFMEAQPLVLTKVFDLEKTKGHAHFTKDDPFPFETKGKLGKGGFGDVDRILSPLSGREFARKRFRRTNSMRRAEIDSFMNELQIFKRLSHIHCVELSTTAETAPLLRTFFGCLAGALDHLHEAKIRHRDIKPQNILVKGSHVYLTDFGLSLDWENLSGSTTTQDTAKTKLYCAPEIARFEKRNTSSDIWSLGCVFVEMLTLIKGRTIEEQQQFFKRRIENYRFYENISGIQAWVGQLRQIDSNQTSDSFIADYTLGMLKDNPTERLSTEKLYNKISNYRDLDEGEENPLCGECCVSDTFSVSDSGSDRDPLAETTEL